MKTRLLLIFLLSANVLFSQVSSEKSQSGDPFLNSVLKIFFLENISYEVSSKKKALFDLDTAYSQAKVTVKKQGDSIIFLHIINSTQQDELLLYSDSVWYVRHQEKELRFIGKGIDGAGRNYLLEHFPVSLYTIDTLINQVNPFWRIIRENELYNLVSIDIATKPEEVSDLRVEILIKHSDSLIYSMIQDVGFKGMTVRLFQEETFRNYTFPTTDQVVLPAYFNNYKKIIPDYIAIDGLEKSQSDSVKQDIFLQSIELYDLEENPFRLPEEGLIFFDLWYVGCFPCMKAAPVIEKLFNEYKDSIHFYSVNEVDSDKEKIKRFRDMKNISFPMLLGGKEKLSVKVNGRSGYPLFILMDAQSGKVLWKLEGYTENLEELIKNAIDQNL